MNNVQKHNNYINIPSSQICISNPLTIAYKEGDFCRRQKC
jgi:hypothetical protein